jgi:hypothetical protein
MPQSPAALLEAIAILAARVGEGVAGIFREPFGWFGSLGSQ